MYKASIFRVATALSVVTVMAVPDTAGAQTANPAPSVAPRIPFAFAGEVRTRSEWDHPGGPAPADLFTFLRARFGLSAEPSPHVRILLQAQDSRVLGAEGNPAARAVEEFGLHQAYVELRAPWRGTRASLRAGRQEIALGNERLLGAVGWSNTGRSFDGARATLERDRTDSSGRAFSATLLAATVEERGRHFGAPADSGAARDHVLAAVSTAVGFARSGLLEGTILYDGGGHYRTFVSADRVTMTARLRTPRVFGLVFEVEGAGQRGHQIDTADSAKFGHQSLQAWMAGTRVSTAPSGRNRATIAIGADVLSGDANPHDAKYGAFSTLYGSNHAFYGLMDVIGDPAAATHERGLVDLLATGAISLGSRVTLLGELHRFAFASGGARDIGWEADLLVPLRLLPNAAVDLGVSAFRAGRHASAIGLGQPGTIREWAYVQLRVGF